MSAASRSPPSARKLFAAARAIRGSRCSASESLLQYVRKPAGSFAARGELAGMRSRPQVIAFVGAVHLPLHELIDERRDLRVASRALQRAKLEPKRRGVRAGLLAQRLQHGERVERPPLLELHLGVEHHSRHGEASGLRRMAGKCASAVAIVARVERGAGRNQRRDAGRIRNLERFLRELARLPVAPLEQRDDRGVELRPHPRLPLAAAHRAHLGRQPRRTGRDAHERIARNEARDERAREAD